MATRTLRQDHHSHRDNRSSLSNRIAPIPLRMGAFFFAGRREGAGRAKNPLFPLCRNPAGAGYTALFFIGAHLKKW